METSAGPEIAVPQEPTDYPEHVDRLGALDSQEPRDLPDPLDLRESLEPTVSPELGVPRASRDSEVRADSLEGPEPLERLENGVLRAPLVSLEPLAFQEKRAMLGDKETRDREDLMEREDSKVS